MNLGFKPIGVAAGDWDPRRSTESYARISRHSATSEDSTDLSQNEPRARRHISEGKRFAYEPAHMISVHVCFFGLSVLILTALLYGAFECLRPQIVPKPPSSEGPKPSSSAEDIGSRRVATDQSMGGGQAAEESVPPGAPPTSEKDRAAEESGGPLTAASVTLIPPEAMELIPHERDLDLDQWAVRRLQGNGTFTEWSDLEKEADSLLRDCDFWWHLTASSQKTLSKGGYSWFMNGHAQWLNSTKTVRPESRPCYLILTPKTSLPLYAKDLPDVTDEERRKARVNDKYKVKLHAPLALVELASRWNDTEKTTIVSPGKVDSAVAKRHSHPDSDQPFFAMATDFDIWMTNKSRTWEALLDRIDRGVRNFAAGQTTIESRLCDTWEAVNPKPKTPFPCDRSHIQATRDGIKSLADISLVIAIDDFPESGWVLNSGVFLTQPDSITTRFMMESALALMSNQRIRGMPKAEQGRLAYVLSNAFGINLDIFNWIERAGREDPMTVWGNGDSDEIAAIGMLDIRAAEQSPYFSLAAKKWLRDAPKRSHPLGVAIVHPRWMNAPACAKNYGNPWRFKPQRIFQCGDMIAHFNGCGKTDFQKLAFRKQVRQQCEDSPDWPYKLFFDGTAFDWDRWEAEGQ